MTNFEYFFGNISIYWCTRFSQKKQLRSLIIMESQAVIHNRRVQWNSRKKVWLNRFENELPIPFIEMSVCGAPNDGWRDNVNRMNRIECFVAENVIHGHDFSHWFIITCACVCVDVLWRRLANGSSRITIDFATSLDNTMAFCTGFSPLFGITLESCWRTPRNEGNRIDMLTAA